MKLWPNEDRLGAMDEVRSFPEPTGAWFWHITSKYGSISRENWSMVLAHYFKVWKYFQRKMEFDAGSLLQSNKRWLDVCSSTVLTYLTILNDF